MGPSKSFHSKVAELGKLVVRMTARSGSGHPSSALSLVHIVTHLMYRQMRYDPSNPFDPHADRLVLSEGHAVPIVYAAWADLGGLVGRTEADRRALGVDDVDLLRARDSFLDGHPNPAEGFPFFDAATGSLGQGLSAAAGLALGARLDRTGRRVFVIVGDGESREGQIWEAADFIADHRLNNVCAVFNANGEGQAGPVSVLQNPGRLGEKLDAFGWKVVAIDGHDAGEIESAFALTGRSERPLAIVARTVKGWGVDGLQGGNWHGKPLKADDLEAANASLDKATAGHPEMSLSGPRKVVGSGDVCVGRPESGSVAWPLFSEALEEAGMGDALGGGKLATRRAYGVALRMAGKLLPQVVALDGDVSNSTFSNIFAKSFPERFFECKIAEQNMISAGVGLSAAGFIPFANSFAKFLSRGYDQVEMASISRANLKLVGSHAGISLAADGPSQMSLPDVAFFNAFSSVTDDNGRPLCWMYQPSDAYSAYHCTRLMAGQVGLGYMRTHRPDVPVLYDEKTTFEPGGFHVLVEGGDLAVVTAGYMVHPCKAAVETLSNHGLKATLIDAYSLPLQQEKLYDALRQAGGRALVVEDNYGGGLASAVAEMAARRGGVIVDILRCRRIPKSTRTSEEVLDLCGVGLEQITSRAQAFAQERG